MKASSKKAVIISASVLSLLIVLLAINYFIWQRNYKDRFYPGESIGSLVLSGKTPEETKEILSAKFEKINEAGLSFSYNGRTEKLDLDVLAFDSDLARPTLNFDAEKCLEAAFSPAEHSNFFYYLISRLSSKSRKNASPVYALDEDAVKSFLAENFNDLNIAPANAYFSLAESNPAIRVVANQERPGKSIDYEKAFADLHNSLSELEVPAIQLKTASLYPDIKKADLAGLEDEATKLVGRSGLMISFVEAGGASTTKYWKIKPEKLATWISLDRKGDSSALSFDKEKIKEYLQVEISPEVDVEAVLPRLEIKNGKVSSWQTGKSGRMVDLDASAQRIAEDLLASRNASKIITKEVAGQDIKLDSTLQIKEIIGTGHSKFTGSSANRIKNIRNGGNSLQGILIKPGEEFSLIKALGKIDGSSGYVEELVIKGDKTTPEFGGGLCQIGTTVFRAALSSGLPITMRQNHSYRVSYYEPAGTDATIYDPRPDLRFINDTGNYILLQYRIEKDNLYFDFWGTKDGRVATTTYPTIYNIVKPAPTKMVETTALKPGQKKCTEGSHNGADAFFDYKVIYPEGATSTRTVEKRFTSHYVPWQGVCLIGVAATSSPAVKATSTPGVATSTAAASSSIPKVQN